VWFREGLKYQFNQFTKTCGTLLQLQTNSTRKLEPMVNSKSRHEIARQAYSYSTRRMKDSSSIIPIYLQPFTSYSKILVGNCNFSLYPFAFNALVGGVSVWIPGKNLVLRILESKFRRRSSCRMRTKSTVDLIWFDLTIYWAVLTQYQRVTDWRTDGLTDVQPISIRCAVILTHVKNWNYRIESIVDCR